VHSSFLMVKPKAVSDGALLDERFFIHAEEKDLCLRLGKAGWRVVFVLEAEIIHHGGQSTALDPAGNWFQYQHSQVLFFRKHHTAAYARALETTLLGVLLGRSLAYFLPSLFSRLEGRQLR